MVDKAREFHGFSKVVHKGNPRILRIPTIRFQFKLYSHAPYVTPHHPLGLPHDTFTSILQFLTLTLREYHLALWGEKKGEKTSAISFSNNNSTSLQNSTLTSIKTEQNSLSHFFPATPWRLNSVPRPQPTASMGCQPSAFSQPPHPWDNHYWVSIKTLLSKPPEQCHRSP